MRLRTASGITELMTFYVGALPQVAEKEPNNEFTAPQKIPLNVTRDRRRRCRGCRLLQLRGQEGAAGDGRDRSHAPRHDALRSYVAILDSKRFELAASDDAPLLGQDSVVSVIIPADGTYVIQVRESAYGGNGACMYRLHVGTFPRPTAVVPAGGKMGRKSRSASSATRPASSSKSSNCPRRIRRNSASSPRTRAASLHRRTTSACPSIPTSSKSSRTTPTPGHSRRAALRLNGVIARPGETDFFRFKCKKGETYDVHCYAAASARPSIR